MDGLLQEFFRQFRSQLVAFFAMLIHEVVPNRFRIVGDDRLNDDVADVVDDGRTEGVIRLVLGVLVRL